MTVVSSLMDRLLDLSKNSIQYGNSMCPSMIRKWKVIVYFRKVFLLSKFKYFCFVTILEMSLISRSCTNDHIIFNVGVPSLEARNIRLVNIILYILPWHLLGHAIKSVTCFDLQFSRSTRPMTSFCMFIAYINTEGILFNVKITRWD